MQANRRLCDLFRRSCDGATDVHSDFGTYARAIMPRFDYVCTEIVLIYAWRAFSTHRALTGNDAMVFVQNLQISSRSTVL